ncbi:hypothetical protein [Streptomyces halobius]|uniref:Uncharacterized protein n=1 Tax=Streptomyces halobius TaxID=2879846 RepID=A0ABY4MGX4_9ACTN|nr:hypothetical protein [Streptomyces halobius]UQA96768.1 hypothetical protein K9S39_37235 [Streptomyces halobius]
MTRTRSSCNSHASTRGFHFLDGRDLDGAGGDSGDGDDGRAGLTGPSAASDDQRGSGGPG